MGRLVADDRVLSMGKSLSWGGWWQMTEFCQWENHIRGEVGGRWPSRTPTRKGD